MFFKGRIMTGGDLPQTSKPGSDIEAPKMLQVIFLEIIFRMRAWPNDAHVPLQNVKKLRQFIDAVFAQETSQAGDSRVVSNLESCAVTLVHVHQAILELIGINHHGAEFMTTELASFSSNAPGAINDRAGRIELDGYGSYRQDRGCQQQRHYADE